MPDAVSSVLGGHGIQLHADCSVDFHCEQVRHFGKSQPAGIAIVVYGLVGVFGAARYGLATEGDLLVNRWLHGRAEGVFDAVLVAYLAISIPPIQVHRVLLAAKVLRPDTTHDPLE
jgi:hypothetical protein